MIAHPFRSTAGGTLRRAVRAFAILALAASVPQAAQAQLRDLLPFGRTHTISSLLSAVVAIETVSFVKDTSEGNGDRRVEHFGSGFIVDSSGVIVTNHHVVDGVAEINITLHSGAQLKGKVIGDGGSNIDIALIQVKADKPLPVVKWGDSHKVRVGDQVFAAGNPLGVGESVSSGIVSALNRNISETPYDDFIQTDAAINHGNSGGPLVNTHGDVIGVNTAIFSPTDSGSIGLGFAIPGNDVQFVIDRLRKFGKLGYGYLGVRMQDVTTDMAEAMGLGRPRGVIIAAVLPDTPASAAGIQVGDVIVKFGNVVPTDIRALGRLSATAKIGAPVNVVAWRDGREVTLPVTIKEWPEDSENAPAAAPVSTRRPSTDPAVLGLQLAILNDDQRSRFKLPGDVDGVVVQQITPNSSASDQGLAVGNVILRVQQSQVKTPEEVQQKLAAVRGQGRSHALVLVQGRSGLKWVTLPVGN